MADRPTIEVHEVTRHGQQWHVSGMMASIQESTLHYLAERANGAALTGHVRASYEPPARSEFVITVPLAVTRIYLTDSPLSSDEGVGSGEIVSIDLLEP
jgi:hypothetical protein